MAKESQTVWVVMTDSACEGERSSDISGHQTKEGALKEYATLAAQQEDIITQAEGQGPIYISDQCVIESDKLQDSWVAEESEDERGFKELSFYRYGEYDQEHVTIMLRRISINASGERTPLKKIKF